MRVVSAALLLAALALAGCTTDDSDDGGDVMEDPSADSVAITSSPTTNEAGDDVEVCWRVVGHGTIPHTAVHWDNESHADDSGATFGDYNDGVAYPTESGADSQSYDLGETGADFCAKFTLPEEAGTIYLVAHAMTASPGIISDEAAIIVTIDAT